MLEGAAVFVVQTQGLHWYPAKNSPAETARLAIPETPSAKPPGRLIIRNSFVSPKNPFGFYFPARPQCPIADKKTSHFWGLKLRQPVGGDPAKVAGKRLKNFFRPLLRLLQPRCAPGGSPRNRNQPSAPPAAKSKSPARKTTATDVSPFAARNRVAPVFFASPEGIGKRRFQNTRRSKPAAAFF